MTWQRSIDLYYNVQAPGAPLIDPDAQGIKPADTPILIAGDHITLNVHLRRPATEGDNYWQPIAIPSGETLIIAGKPLNAISQDDLLFYAEFTEVTGESIGTYYTAQLDLNTAPIDTALGTSASISARIDLELQNALNTRRATLQADITIRQQAYDGTEGEPSAGNPPYPIPSLLLLTTYGGSQEIAASTISIDLDYTALALAAAPAAILLTVRKPSADSPQIFCNLVGAASATAQNIMLSAPTPDAGDPFHIDYLIIPA